VSISHRVPPADPDAGIPDLIRNLADDSKRLVSDEMRLAKLEMTENVKRAGRGGMWLGLAFGVGFVALVAFTILLSALIGRLASGHYWVGAIVTGLLELVVAVVLFKKGMSEVKEPSYTLEGTRHEAGKTVRWAKAEIRAS
jgi:uncharacterized membrane protein YqjE